MELKNNDNDLNDKFGKMDMNDNDIPNNVGHVKKNRKVKKKAEKYKRNSKEYIEYINNNYLYSEYDGIKIYNKNLLYDNDYIDYKLEVEKANVTKSILTNLEICTVTSCGYMEGLNFIEKDLISILKPPKNNILKICCNYGEIYNEFYKDPPVKIKSKKGRKPNKKKQNRKKNGTGVLANKYFSSQISFLVASNDRWKQNAIVENTPQILNFDQTKIFKIKLFRNGMIQIPGGMDPNLLDIIEPLKCIKNYISEQFEHEINIKYIIPEMINYKCKLINSNYRLCPKRIENYLISYKNSSISCVKIEHIQYQLNLIKENKTWGLTFIETLEKCNEINMAETILKDSLRLVKIYHPNKVNKEKKITIKLLQSGKINIDGCNSIKMISYIYWFFNNFLSKGINEFIFDITNLPITNDDDYDDDGNESIYDDMIQ